MIDSNDNRPATKGDVRHAQEELVTMMTESFEDLARKEDVGRLEGDIADIKQTMATKDMVERIITILDSIEGRLKDLPDKVDRVYQRVFGSHQ